MAPLSGAAATPDRDPWSRRRHGTGSARRARTSYEIDRDRIIHSETFRELQDKTQVQSLVHASAYMSSRTRLNHVIEVAQLARGIARELEADEALAEAIGLAHDLGHPPFGHAGELALRQALEERGAGAWNANVHSLAVVEEIERTFVAFRGLDLTWATREGIARHSTPYDEPVSVGEFATTPNGGLECQIVDAADVLAYMSHDLDDAIGNDFIEVEAAAAVSGELERILREAERSWDEGKRAWPDSERGTLLRRFLIAKFIGAVIRDLAATTVDRLRDHDVDSPEDVRACGVRLVAQSPPFAETTTALLGLLSERYYRSDQVRRADEAAGRLIRALFDALYEHPDEVPERFHVGPLAIAVATYLASLNDRTATARAAELGVAQEVPSLADARAQARTSGARPSTTLGGRSGSAPA